MWYAHVFGQEFSKQIDGDLSMRFYFMARKAMENKSGKGLFFFNKTLSRCVISCEAVKLFWIATQMT